jgi:uncharacterized protein YraI
MLQDGEKAKAKSNNGEEAINSSPDHGEIESSKVEIRTPQRKFISESFMDTFSNPGFGVVFTASVTLLTAVIVNSITTWQSLKIEEKRYEYSLLSEYLVNLPANEEELESVSKRLIFLLDIGAIGTLNTEKIREYAENPETLPELYVFANAPPGYSLNIRSGPGYEYSIVRRIARGSPLEVTGSRRNGWVQLSDGNWVAGNLVAKEPGIEPIPSANIATVHSPPGTSANIHTGPGFDFPIVGQYLNGSRIPTTGKINNGWVELTNGNWISSENIKSADSE